MAIGLIHDDDHIFRHLREELFHLVHVEDGSGGIVGTQENHAGALGDRGDHSVKVVAQIGG